jgi:hypothetical protein
MLVEEYRRRVQQVWWFVKMTCGVAPAAYFSEETVSALRAHVQLRHPVVAQFEIAVAGDVWYEEVLYVALLCVRDRAFLCMLWPILGTGRWPSVALLHRLYHLWPGYEVVREVAHPRKLSEIYYRHSGSERLR